MARLSPDGVHPATMHVVIAKKKQKRKDELIYSARQENGVPESALTTSVNGVPRRRNVAMQWQTTGTWTQRQHLSLRFGNLRLAVGSRHRFLRKQMILPRSVHLMSFKLHWQDAAFPDLHISSQLCKFP